MHLRLLISIIPAAGVIAILTAYPAVARAQIRTWTSPNPGDLLTNSNWSDSSAPNAADATAVFDTNLTEQGDFTLNGSMTLGQLNYSASGFREVTGTGTLTMQASSGNALYRTTGSGYLDINGPDVVLNSTTEFSINAVYMDLFSTVSGSGGIVKTGSQGLVLHGNNSYAGLNTINEAYLSGNTIANNGINSAFGRGNFAIYNGATLDYTGGNASTNRSVTLGAGGGVISVSRVGAGATLTISGTISGVGSLTKSGIRSLVLSGNNSYDGGTIITGGGLAGAVIADFGINSSFGRGNFSIANGATLQYVGSNGSTNRIISLGIGGGALDVGSTANPGAVLTLNGEINGSGELKKHGPGTLQLNASNTYGNSTTVTEGTLRLGASERIPDASALSQVFFTPDSRELIISRGEEFSFWDIESLQPLRRIHRDVVLYPGHVGFSPDGRLMALEMAPGVIHLKDVATARTVARLEDPYGDRANWIGFTPDGTQLAVVAHYATSVHTWDLRAIRTKLKSMGLDWDWPPFDTVESHQVGSQSGKSVLRVKVHDSTSLNEPQTTND
jgi:autotransporter-associated beta strand protein